jgi:hypothetical protein
MKTTSDYHGFQIQIITAETEYFWNKSKVYRSRATAEKIVGKITSGLDDGKYEIPDFRYCKIVELFA